MQLKSYQAFLSLIIFMIIFYFVDILRLYLGEVYFFHINRVFTWVLPTFLFIYFILKKNPFDYLKLVTSVKRGVFWAIIVSVVHILIYCLSHFLLKGKLTINYLDFWEAWDKIIIVGMIEEVVFRGLVLQNLNETLDFKISNIISSLLFVLAHIPYWYIWHSNLPIINLAYDCLYVFIFGLFWGFLLKKTKSLWPCIIHHSINNLLALMIK